MLAHHFGSAQILGRFRSEADIEPRTRPAESTGFVAQAYAEAFGYGPGQAQIEHFVAQVEYFESIYADSGAYGSAERIELLARGAVYGQMLGISAELELL
jgi:hypothetical protein